MEIIIKTFSELTLYQLHDIFLLRNEVFVVEQDCVYQDIDGKDPVALHVLGQIGERLIAYSRCFAPGIYFKEAAIGRVAVKKQARNKGFGNDILKASIAAINKEFHTGTIKLSAQSYLISFYEAHGFQVSGPEYLEDGIPHVPMITTLSSSFPY